MIAAESPVPGELVSIGTTRSTGSVEPLVVPPPEFFANVAVTDSFAVIVTVHEPVPVHAPDQPLKLDPDAGVAERVTEAPLVSDAEQVDPQLIDPPVTVPVPVPAVLAVRV
jgi:hypothetical protein